jgi:aminopeptidase
MTSTNTPGFEERLERLATAAVRVGLGLRPGQDLVLTASVEALPLVRAIARQAYAAGAGLVTPILGDEEVALARYRHGREECFDADAGWLYRGMAEAYRGGAARLAITGENPTLMAGQDPDRVSRADRARARAYRPAMDEIVNFRTNWTIVPAATPAWARTVFPDLPVEEAMAALWDAIFRSCRIDGDDPVAEWDRHNAELSARTSALNGARHHALRFRGPGTDLVVGLADDHEWCGGRTVTPSGIPCNANIPTEEVFTTPHRMRVQGHVSATKPLSYQGTLIDGIAVRFEEGRIVESRARTGGDVLAKVIDTDEGARRLGEVALVPASSPISASGLLFCNTLYDENAASHIALGQAYSKCFLNGGAGLNEQDLAARGANRSLIHIDWMIGSAEVDIDGVTPEGRSEPLMRRGEWVD